MLRSGFLLLALSILSISAFPRQYLNQTIAEIDGDGSTDLKCRWIGFGEHCPPVEVPADGVDWRNGRFRIPFLNKNETKSEFMERIKEDYPVNTFNIIKSTNVSDKCEIQGLQCSSLFGLTDYSQYKNMDVVRSYFGKYYKKNNLQFHLHKQGDWKKVIMRRTGR